MIYAPPQYVELQYRPSYSEIGDASIREKYRITEHELIQSREGSEYVRRKIAQLELNRRLKQLASLPTNWDGNGADPPLEPAISNAAALIDSFIHVGLIPDALTTSVDGGVAICFVRTGKYADVECLNDGEVLAVRYSSQDNPTAWVVQPNSVASDATVQFFSTYLSA